MQQTTVFNSSPSFESEAKPDQIPNETVQSVQDVNPPTQTEPSPSVEFVPYIDEIEEKKKFWKTVIITMGGFLVISVIIIGVVISNRLSQPRPKLDIQYLDGGPSSSNPTTVIISRRPSRYPSASVPPVGGYVPVQTGITRIPTTPPRLVTVPFVIVNNNTVSPTSGSTAPTPTIASGTSATPVPTSVPTLLPTTTPTPTVYLIVPTSLVFDSVTSSETKTANMINMGNTPVTISNMYFLQGGSDNPFTFANSNSCTYFSGTPTPVTLKQSEQTCIAISFNPSQVKQYSNAAYIVMSPQGLITISLAGTKATPTPTNTPTSTPTTAP